MPDKEIKIPNIGDFKDVEVIEVLVSIGQSIKKNDPLITIESDKSSVEIHSTHEGIIKSLNVKVGDKVSEGNIILTLDIKEEVVKEEKKEKNLPKEEKNNNILNTEKKITSVNIFKKVLASPKARKFARELGVNINEIPGTKREGRVIEDDIKNHIKTNFSNFNDSKKEDKKKEKIEVFQKYKHEDFGIVNVGNIPRVKKLAAPHLTKAWNEIPHVTQHDEVDITEMDEFRKTLKDSYSGEKIKTTPLAFIMRAVVKALKDFPNFNSSLNIEKNQIIYKKYYHIGVAVDTPHGLMVPKIRNVEKKNITNLSKELKEISENCKNLKLNKKEFYGGSMTISSLGGIGGSFFTPIINFPEVAILGVSQAKVKQIYSDGRFQNRMILPLSLSYDHRIIDGAEAVRFCNHLKASLGKDFAFKLAV